MHTTKFLWQAEAQAAALYLQITRVCVHGGRGCGGFGKGGGGGGEIIGMDVKFGGVTCLRFRAPAVLEGSRGDEQQGVRARGEVCVIGGGDDEAAIGTPGLEQGGLPGG